MILQVACQMMVLVILVRNLAVDCGLCRVAWGCRQKCVGRRRVVLRVVAWIVIGLVMQLTVTVGGGCF